MAQPFAVVAVVKDRESNTVLRGIELIAFQEKSCWDYVEQEKRNRSDISFKVMSIAQARTLNRFSYGRKDK